MNELAEFERYLEHLGAGLGHAGLRGYCTGLMAPLKRKSAVSYTHLTLPTSDLV